MQMGYQDFRSIYIGDLEGHNPEPSVFNLQQIESLPVTATHLKKATDPDPDLSKILHFVKEGWPPQVEAEFKAYHRRRNELSSEAGYILGRERNYSYDS